MTVGAATSPTAAAMEGFPLEEKRDGEQTRFEYVRDTAYELSVKVFNYVATKLVMFGSWLAKLPVRAHNWTIAQVANTNYGLVQRAAFVVPGIGDYIQWRAEMHLFQQAAEATTDAEDIEIKKKIVTLKRSAIEADGVKIAMAVTLWNAPMATLYALKMGIDVFETRRDEMHVRTFIDRAATAAAEEMAAA